MAAGVSWAASRLPGGALLHPCACAAALVTRRCAAERVGPLRWRGRSSVGMYASGGCGWSHQEDPVRIESRTRRRRQRSIERQRLRTHGGACRSRRSCGGGRKGGGRQESTRVLTVEGGPTGGGRASSAHLVHGQRRDLGLAPGRPRSHESSALSGIMAAIGVCRSCRRALPRDLLAEPECFGGHGLRNRSKSTAAISVGSSQTPGRYPCGTVPSRIARVYLGRACAGSISYATASSANSRAASKSRASAAVWALSYLRASPATICEQSGAVSRILNDRRAYISSAEGASERAAEAVKQASNKDSHAKHAPERIAGRLMSASAANEALHSFESSHFLETMLETGISARGPPSSRILIRNVGRGIGVLHLPRAQPISDPAGIYIYRPPLSA